MIDIKFKYTVVRESGHIFSETFPLVDIESGYVQSWLTFNNVGRINNKLFKLQFTGLRDKNGVDIYEGDIVKILQTDWPSQVDLSITLDEYLDTLTDQYVVDFFEGSFVATINGEYVHSLHPGTHGYVEIIGNIHENKELLA